MDTKKLENNQYFKKQILKKGELLFDEGDKNSNIYIILSGNLKVEKYIDKEKNETKILAFLKKGDIFGEGALSNNKAKEVKISALDKANLLKIDSCDFEKFIVGFPKDGIKMLNSIINLSNKRLLESNSLLTTSYNISKIISEKQEFSNKNLFKIIDEILEILEVDYILVLEKNPIMKNYFKFIYDTRKKGKMQNNIIEITKSELNTKILSEKLIEIGKNNFIQKLINRNENIGYLIFGQNKIKFNETQLKTINSISVMIAGFIIQKQYLQSEKYKEINKGLI